MGNAMQYIANDGRQDKYIMANNDLNAQITGHHLNVTECNTLLLCHYKDCIVSTLSIDVVMLICKFINPMFHPVWMFNYLDLKRERALCFTTFILCVQNSALIMPPKDIKKILFKEYLAEIPPPKPFIFDEDIT